METTARTASRDKPVELRDGDRPWVLILANPFSGSGPTKQRVADLVAALERRGLPARVVWDLAERKTLLGDPSRLHACCCLVAAGGDGTVADVINEMPAGVPLATMPAGNENLFAREFGFVADGEALARAIEARRSRQIDLGRFDRRLFSLMLSAGFDADVAHRVARWRAEHRGALKRVKRLSYAKPILDSLRKYRYCPIELEADGVRVRGTHVLIFNLPQYGFQLPFAPDARADDGLLDWLVFQRPGLHHLASYCWSLLCSKHRERRDVCHGRARRIRLRTSEPVPVQADGDQAGTTPVEIEVVPQALRVVVP